EHLIASGAVAFSDGYIVPKGHAGAMSSEDQALYDAILAEFEHAGLQPPGLKELKCLTPRNEKRVGQLVHLAAARGRLVRVADGMWLHERPHGELVRSVVRSLRLKPEMTVAELRNVLNSTRKYVVPFLEHLDAIGVTKRSGDFRTLGAKAPE
ncbi:MAG TPA: SelB C-terminal domain-containing protein, partial [Vicinamibacterales bacterium]|nr:SelB C-terminal domain-containing protein [Vicinamibacterales bacterium]